MGQPWTFQAWRSDLRAAAVPPERPGDVFLFHPPFQLQRIAVTVDSEEGERLAIKALHERPFVRVHGPAGATPIAPEVEHHHLPPVVRELHRAAVQVFAGDLGGGLADGETPDLVKLASASLARSPSRSFVEPNFSTTSSNSDSASFASASGSFARRASVCSGPVTA